MSLLDQRLDRRDLPPGYFDQNGRGGAACNEDGSVTSMGAADRCTFPQPGGPNFELSRAGAGVVP